MKVKMKKNMQITQHNSSTRGNNLAGKLKS